MKKVSKKILGEERREKLFSLLKETNTPITGSELAKRTGVSRQVIVGDINLLKARHIPIIATSQGYLYMRSSQESHLIEKSIVCRHTPDQTEEELNILVDHGITIKTVAVEHPIYGDITASLMVSNRKEVEQFLHNIKKTNSSFLADLTSGIHLHTIAAPSKEAIDQAELELKAAGILLDED